MATTLPPAPSSGENPPDDVFEETFNDMDIDMDIDTGIGMDAGMNGGSGSVKSFFDRLAQRGTYDTSILKACPPYR